MPGGQFPGLPRRALEPASWRPVLWQTAATRAEGNRLAMRRPGDEGWYVQNGLWVTAQATVVFNSAGTGANILVLRLPIAVQYAANAIQSFVVGHGFLRRSGAWNYPCTITTQDSDLAVFRTQLTAADAAWGSNPNIAIAAGDELAINLSYLGF